ncbi:MAG: ABC transporter ATP-binding protein [Rhodospirillaceae bacterium]|nr:ABC transporter ATP-binding protein [Rhodospirillaceae bacterium]
MTAIAQPRILDTRSLSVSLGGRSVLSDIDVRLTPGTLIGLIGPNGAGKTTLLRALAGLARPASGEVKLDNRDLTEWPRAALAKHIGYLPQDRAIHWPLSVRRIAGLGRLPHLDMWQRASADDERHIARALHQADVEHLAERPVTSLSGGEQARAAIARLLAGEPTVILADEPTAGLDPAHKLRVLELMRSLAAEGRIVVVVLHDLTLAARYCDRLLLMADGRLAADGAPGQVLTHAALAASFGLGAKITHEDGALVVLPWSWTDKPVPRL